MTKDNQPISLYTIENASGASVTLSDYGCRIIKIMVPNKEGKLTDVILGLMNADEYLADDASLGAVPSPVWLILQEACLFTRRT